MHSCFLKLFEINIIPISLQPAIFFVVRLIDQFLYKKKIIFKLINPFVSNGFSLYTLKTSEYRKVFEQIGQDPVLRSKNVFNENRIEEVCNV